MISRTLSRRITLVTADADVLQAIRYLECDPEILQPRPDETTISIERHRAYYRILQDGELLREQMTAKGVTETLHAHLLVLSFADYATAPIIHAASLRRGGRRLLLVGQKAAGKTTLVLSLIQAGYEVEGDENVFVTPNGVVARPRGLRVKQSAAALVPGLTQVLAAAPYYQDAQGQRIYNVDPRQAGAVSWRIEQGPVAAVFILHPNHGGYSSLRSVSTLQLMRDVIAECGLSITDRGKAISTLTKLFGTSKGFDLSLGDPVGAVTCINTVFEDLA